MENEDPLWVQVEMSIASWCWKNQQLTGKCGCPSQSQLEQASPEVLTRLLTALNNKDYLGDWEQYLNA